jgi:glycosyltransferase involved in cell wall biosynthesis
VIPIAANDKPSRISCIICAYNEAPRIGAVLSVATSHPMLLEVIVVNDGSTDTTAEVVAQFPSVRLITRPVNGGKSVAIADGIAAAQGELLMLLDADLKGLSHDNLGALAAPVLTGRADVSMSLRQNSLLIFRALGIDFVSGERVVRKALLETVLGDIRKLPRFGIEMFMNRRIIESRLRVAVTHWPRVTQARKTEKLGYWQGVRAEWRMITDLLRAVYPLSLISQTVQLSWLRISEGRAPFAARMRAPADTSR